MLQLAPVSLLFLGAPKQGLTGKIDVLQQICGFLLVFASKVWNFNFTLLLDDMKFTHLLVSRDEANYLFARRRYACGVAELISS